MAIGHNNNGRERNHWIISFNNGLKKTDWIIINYNYSWLGFLFY